jgi:hypothetical protein
MCDPVRIVNGAGNSAAVLNILGVYRLAVDATLAAVPIPGIVTNEPDDNDILENLQTLVDIPLNYMHNPATNRWIRMEGGVDNGPAGATAVQAQYIAGIARAALAVYADGDTCVPTFDIAGRLMTNSGNIIVENDDDSILAAQDHDTVIPLNYAFDGTNWRRVQAMAVAAATDERLMHLLTGASAYGRLSGAAAGSKSVPIEANTPGTTPMDERYLALYALAHLRGLDIGLAAGSQDVAIAADTADAIPADERLEGIYSLAFMRALDTSQAAGAMGRALQARVIAASVDERLYELLVGARVIGTNTSAAAGSQGVPIEGRPTGTGLMSEALQYLFVRAHLAALDQSQAGGQKSVPVEARLPSAISGLAVGAPWALMTAAIATGIDNTGAAVLRPVEARAGVATLTDTFYRLFTQALLTATDGSFTRRILASASLSVAGSETESAVAMDVVQARASGFAAARRGKRFVTANQTPGTDVTVPVVGAFDATKPLLMLRVNSAAIRAIVRSLKVQLTNTPGSLVRLQLCIDTADRYSAAGTAVVPQNTNEESVTAAVALAYETPTASAAGAGTRYLQPGILNPVQGEEAEFNLEDGVLLGPTAATLLVYAWQASGTAGTLTWWMEHEEVS